MIGNTKFYLTIFLLYLTVIFRNIDRSLIF